MTDEKQIISLFFTEIKDDIREIKTDVKEIFQSMHNQPCSTNTDKILRIEQEIKEIKKSNTNRPMKVLAFIVGVASISQALFTILK